MWRVFDILCEHERALPGVRTDDVLCVQAAGMLNFSMPLRATLLSAINLHPALLWKSVHGSLLFLKAAVRPDCSKRHLLLARPAGGKSL